MAINWALPVGHSYRAAANSAPYLRLGRTYTQPVPGRNNALFCSGTEVLIKPSAANTEDTVTAFLNGILTFYDPVASTGTATISGLQAILNFDTIDLAYLRPDSVSRLTYEYLDAPSASQALRALITSYQASAPTGTDNILHSTSTREKRPGTTNQYLRLRDFVTDVNKVNSFISDALLGTQPIIVRAGDALGKAIAYSSAFSPVNQSSNGYTRAIRLLFEQGTSNYINPALVLACFAAYTVTHQQLPLSSQTHHCLSEIGLRPDRVTYTHPLVALLHPGGRNTVFPSGQVTLPNGTKPIAPNSAYTEYHGSFANEHINMRWRYSPTTNNNPAANLFTIDVGDQTSATQVTPVSISGSGTAVTNALNTLWQTPALRDLLNGMSRLLDVPADMVAAIIAHESGGTYGTRVSRIEKAREQHRIELLLRRRDLNWTLTESKEEVVRIYQQMVASQRGSGHTTGDFGGYSWSVPATINLNAKVDAHLDPVTKQPKPSLTYRQFFALIDMQPGRLLDNYFASKCSPGLGQVLISTAAGKLSDLQQHPRLQHPTIQAQLTAWGINPLPASTRIPSGMFVWLLDSGNAIKAAFANLFLARDKVYVRTPADGYPYFDKKHRLSHLDLPVLDAVHNKNFVKGILKNYAADGQRARVWGMQIAGEEYFINTINAYNYLRRHPALMNQVECYLQAPTT